MVVHGPEPPEEEQKKECNLRFGLCFDPECEIGIDKRQGRGAKNTAEACRKRPLLLIMTWITVRFSASWMMLPIRTTRLLLPALPQLLPAFTAIAERAVFYSDSTMGAAYSQNSFSTMFARAINGPGIQDCGSMMTSSKKK